MTTEPTSKIPPEVPVQPTINVEPTPAPRAVPSRWPADVTAVASATLASFAVHTALKQHATVEPALMFGGAALVFAGLVGLHLVLRSEPAAPAKPVRKRKKVAKSVMAAEEHAVEPTDLALELTGQVPPHASVRSTAVRQAAPVRAADTARSTVGFEQLQRLVAELAQTTPGPKAGTPDPDRTRDGSMASADRGFAEALERSHAAQTQALSRAARLMQGQQSDAESGLAAELADALSAERMTVYLEPIQQMATERPKHYEISVRFLSATGTELPHAAMMEAARLAGLLPRIDAAIVPRAARIAQHFQLRGRDTDIVARVHGASLPDREFRAEMTAAAIATEGASPVLSFAQADVRSFGRIHWDILSTLADMGVRFAIESVTDLDMDFDALRRRGFAFAKLDADVLLRGLPAEHGLIVAADVCRHFASLGLALVVSHIDDEAVRARILGFGVLFGQGTLFGGRRAVRADLLARGAVAA